MQKIATIATPVATCDEPLQNGQPSEAAINPDQLNELFGLTASEGPIAPEGQEGDDCIAAFDPDKMNELFGLVPVEASATAPASVIASVGITEEQFKDAFKTTILPLLEKVTSKPPSDLHLEDLTWSDTDFVDADLKGGKGDAVVQLFMSGQYLKDEDDNMQLRDRLEKAVDWLKKALPKIESISYDIKVDDGSGEYVSIDVSVSLEPFIKKFHLGGVDLESELKGKTVVLTGKPPSGMTKEKVAALLTSQFKVKTVEPAFTKRTQVVIYNAAQDTKKAQLAAKAGLATFSYEEVIKG